MRWVPSPDPISIARYYSCVFFVALIHFLLLRGRISCLFQIGRVSLVMAAAAFLVRIVAAQRRAAPLRHLGCRPRDGLLNQSKESGVASPRNQNSPLSDECQHPVPPQTASMLRGRDLNLRGGARPPFPARDVVLPLHADLVRSAGISTSPHTRQRHGEKTFLRAADIGCVRAMIEGATSRPRARLSAPRPHHVFARLLT